MASLASRRERRAAWRAVRAFMPGSAIAVRMGAIEDARAGAAYFTAYGLRWLDPDRPNHAKRTTDWRKLWVANPLGGYRQRTP